jgi:hypothetical protein
MAKMKIQWKSETLSELTLEKLYLLLVRSFVCNSMQRKVFCHQQHAGRNHKDITAIKYFENVTKIKYLGGQYQIKINKSKADQSNFKECLLPNSECLYSHLLSNNVQIKVWNNAAISAVVLHSRDSLVSRSGKNIYQ